MIEDPERLRVEIEVGLIQEELNFTASFESMLRKTYWSTDPECREGIARDLMHANQKTVDASQRLERAHGGEPLAGVAVEQGKNWLLIRADMHALNSRPSLPPLDHCMTDPPYSEQVHQSVRSSGRNDLRDRDTFPCRTRRQVDLGFEHLTEQDRQILAWYCAAHVARWTLVFSDVESCHLWRDDLKSAGLNYVRTGSWVRIGGAPQFSGDRPAAGFEVITICHPKGRSRWNGGGKAAVYRVPIVANRKRGADDDGRCHSTQKPERLMSELVGQFSDEGETIFDPFAGSGTTGVAALQQGRRFVGFERDPANFATACDRLRAAETGRSVVQLKRKEKPLFELPKLTTT